MKHKIESLILDIKMEINRLCTTPRRGCCKKEEEDISYSYISSLIEELNFEEEILKSIFLIIDNLQESLENSYMELIIFLNNLLEEL